MRFKLIIHIVFALFLFFFFPGSILSSHAKQLSFDLDAPPYREKEAFAIARQMDKLGIKVNVSILDPGELKRKIKSGRAQAYLTDWGSAFFDPFDLAQPKLTSEGRGNFSFYSNKKIDELLLLGATSSSTRKRKQAYHEIQDIIFKQAPWVFGYTLENIEAVSKNVENFIPAMDNRINLHDVTLKKGETFIAGMNTDAFQSLDPAMFRSRETETVIRNMFDALVTRTVNGLVVPELAQSWEQKDDKTYIFKIRRDVRFHNNEPMSAKDVIFTFKRVLTPDSISGKSSPRRGLLGPLSKVEQIDESHIRFILDKPFPAFLQALVHFQIVPEKYIKAAGDLGFANHPIGTGPFKFVRGNLEKEIVMERFPGYYGGSPELPPAEPPKIKTAVFRTMPDSEDRIRSLVSGELSLIQAVPANMVKALKNNDDFKVLSVWGTRSYQVELNNKTAPFNDVRIRKALNYAVNWNAILNNIYMGHGKRLATCFLPGGFGYNHSLKPHHYDIWKARKLIEQAGYELSNYKSGRLGQTSFYNKKSGEEILDPGKWKQALSPAEKKQFKKLIIAVSNDSAPFHFIDDSGNPSGMFIDFWKLWSEKTGIEIGFKNGTWNETLELVKNHEADIHAGLFKSSARSVYLDYGIPLYKSETHYFFHKSIYDIKDFEDLAPFKIGIIKGDFAVDYIKNRLPHASLSIYNDNNELFNAVQNGDVRVFIKDTPIALHHLSRRKILRSFRFNASSPVYDNTFYSAVPKGEKKLLNIVSRGMASVSKTERGEIVRKWMGASDIKTDDVLMISVPDGYMPFTGLDFQGRPSGMFINIWQLWSEKTGKKIEFRVSDMNDSLYSVQNGDADICSGIFFSQENNEKFDFSQPFYRISSNIFYKEKDDINKNIDPVDTGKNNSSYNFGAVSGSYNYDYIQNNYPGSKITAFPDSRTMIKAAMDNRIDMFLEKIPVAWYYLEKLDAGGKFTRPAFPLFKKNIFAGVKKGSSELLAVIDNGFNKISNKELLEIEKQWITIPEIRELENDDSNQIRLTANEKKWLNEHKNIKIGIDPTWPPFDYLGEDGKSHMGIASDYVKLLNKRLGISMQPVLGLSWSEVIDRAGKKNIDVIPCITSTPQRSKFLNFTNPYISFPFVVIVRKESPPLADLNDLAGKTLAVVNDYAAQHHMENNYPKVNLFFTDTPTRGLELVYSGKVDAYLGNLAVTSFIIQKQNIANLKVAAPAKLGDDAEQLKFGVRKDWPQLVSILNKGIETISHRERMEIQKKWFSVRFEYGIDMDYVRSMLVKIGSVAALIIAVILFWNRRLKQEIQEKMKVEKALRKARDQADAANRAKSTFLANMSHEIRTPMNAILGFSQIMLRDKSLQEEQKNNLETIWRSGEHLLGLIDDILEMSKIESGRETLNINSFDLYALLEDLEIMFKVRTDAVKTESGSLEFIVEKSGHLPQYIKTDESKLRQVLINLLGNSVKFTKKGSIILRVSCKTKLNFAIPGNALGCIFFEVEDTGLGIAQEELGKLFQYFEQTESGRKSEGGTGLGLAISASYVDLMGGRIFACSQEGKGSLFRFYICVEPGEEKSSKFDKLPGHVMGLEPGHPEIRILIADDRKTNRDVLLKMLSSAGFSVMEAQNGQEAVNIFSKWSPHLVLMDMVMPEMDGFEATKTIKSMPGGAKTIIFAVSASVLEAEEKTILRFGASEFIRKPFRENELFELIRLHTGASYQYEESVKTLKKQDSPPVSSLTKESINKVPRELIKNMYNAVINGYRKKLYEYIEQVELYDKDTASGLKKLADQYEYEKLSTILE